MFQKLRGQPWNQEGASKFRGIFVYFMTMREKQILATAIGIQKENRG